MSYGNNDFVPIIIGTNLNAYNIARSLHEAYGVRSLALGRYPSRETADSQILEVRARTDFGDPDVVVQVLDTVATEFPGRKLLLLPTIEFYTNIVLERRAQLDPRYVIPLVDHDLAKRLMNKTDFYRTCDELGVPHPATVVVGPGPVDRALGDDLPFPYPVILKPSNTDVYPRLSFAGKQKVYVVPDQTALREIAARIFAAGYDDDLIVQEYLAGDESVMLVANSYSDRHGSMRFASAGQVALTEYDPNLVGNNNAIISVRDDELVESLQRFLDGVGYVGFANFDVMSDERTGTRKLLEVNLRPGATAYYTMAGGGNLVRCAVEDLVYERPLPLEVTTAERLWLNVPYPVVLRYAPRGLLRRIRAAARAGRVHTLKYRPDSSRRRRIDIARVDARHTRDYLRFARRRPH
ncbi:hypothetical protein [Flexivirga meconopsidis]|uniref:carboxylate--amine ligase n=1 Tax=Flexivirga meconopsidis TaxID=2977121 RepID=UPI00223F2EA7|nr:hypothetical protein [Flexivirga meconopsidis]